MRRSGLRSLVQAIFILTVPLGLASAAGHPSSMAQSFAVCVPESIGIDTSLANSSGGDILGEATGQIFYAADTLLSSLTVWRVASECQNFLIGIHLYITKVDSTGRPVTPDIILDGPTLVVPDGDCVHPIKFQWTFDPPFSLPGPGMYAFFLQVPFYQCPSYFDVLGHTGIDAYAGGFLWGTLRSASCGLAGGVVPYRDADLIGGARLELVW